MYIKLKDLLVEGLSGASRATLAHHRKFKALDKKRNKTVQYGDHPENETHASILSKMTNHLERKDQSKQQIPTKRKANNRRVKREVASLTKHETPRPLVARIAGRTRQDYKRRQVD